MNNNEVISQELVKNIEQSVENSILKVLPEIKKAVTEALEAWAKTQVKTILDVSSQIIIWDGNKITEMMQAQGWVGEGTELYYALFSTYGEHEWGYRGDENESPRAKALYDSRENIKKWFENYVRDCGTNLLANKNMTALLIANDQNDLGGCFMHRPIRAQLEAIGISGDRLITGNIYMP
jgi:hypothetical protein